MKVAGYIYSNKCILNAMEPSNNGHVWDQTFLSYVEPTLFCVFFFFELLGFFFFWGGGCFSVLFKADVHVRTGEMKAT